MYINCLHTADVFQMKLSLTEILQMYVCIWGCIINYTSFLHINKDEDMQSYLRRSLLKRQTLCQNRPVRLNRALLSRQPFSLVFETLVDIIECTHSIPQCIAVMSVQLIYAQRLENTHNAL